MQDDNITAYAREAIEILAAEKKALQTQLVELDRMQARQPDVLVCGSDPLASLGPAQRASVMEALYEREYQNARRSGKRQRLAFVEAEIAHWCNRLIRTGRILPVVALFVLMLFPPLARADCYAWPLREQRGAYAYDGDTIYITMPGLPEPISKVSVIDTPEIRGHCNAEKQLAIKAQDRVLVLGASMLDRGRL